MSEKRVLEGEQGFLKFLLGFCCCNKIPKAKKS